MAEQVQLLTVGLAAAEDLYRVLATLHRKHAVVHELTWRADSRGGGQLHLAISHGGLSPAHLRAVLEGVSGVVAVAVRRPASVPAGPTAGTRRVPPTRYVASVRPAGALA